MLQPTDLEIIEVTIEETQKKIDDYEKLMRLEENNDFVELFLKGFEQEAIRLVNAKAYPGNQFNPDREAILDARISMIGQFNVYRQQIINEGQTAEEAMNDHKQTLAEIIQEDGSIKEVI